MNIQESSSSQPYNHQVSWFSTGRSELLSLHHALKDDTKTTHITLAFFK